MIDSDGEIVMVCVMDGDTLKLEDTVFVCVNEGETDVVIEVVIDGLEDIVVVTVLVTLGEFDKDTVIDIEGVIELLFVIELEILGDFDEETVFETVTLFDIVLLGLSDFVAELVGLTLKLGVTERVGLIETGITKSR